MRNLGSGFFVCLLASSMLAATPALAEVVNYAADLSGSNESPPNDSAGKGSAEATYDTDTQTLSWTLTYSGLSGKPIGAHIHGPADAGTNAGIVIPFKTLESPITGSATLNDDQAQSLAAGKFYVNIHTELHPGGELRGQLQKAE